MADNYLENKMEEHRRGTAARPVRKVHASGCDAGVWHLPFAERRVLIVGCGDAVAMMLVERLRAVGCKVAFMGGDKTVGTELARRVGAQFHPVEYGNDTALRRSVDTICRQWHDLDAMIVTVPSLPCAITDEWMNCRKNAPYPNAYGGRLIALSATSLPDGNQLQSLEAYGISSAKVTAESDNDRVMAAMILLNHKFTVA